MIVMYHGDCPDGFCSAFIAKKLYRNAELMPVVHGNSPNLDIARGQNVLVVDFSWNRHQCEQLRLAANTLRIIDHHKTAEAELKDFPNATFDMSRSGAGLTWDLLFPDTPRPWYVNYVEDRDLWKLQLPESLAINGYLMALPHTYEAWATLDKTPLDQALSMGRAIKMHIDNYVEKCVDQRQLGKIDGHSAAIVNAAYLNSSDIGAVLGDFATVGVIWFERGDGLMQFGLRSKSVDVSVIAKHYGGGGHKGAAGFQLPYQRGRAVLDQMLGHIDG